MDHSSSSLPGILPTLSDSPDMSSLLRNPDSFSHDNTKRRSSSRSIKRRRFDDEIVEYSLGLPGASSAIKSTTGGRTRTHSTGSFPVHSTQAHEVPLPAAIPGPAPHLTNAIIPTTPNIVHTNNPSPHIVSEGKKRQHPIKHISTVGNAGAARNKKKGRQHNHLTTKDLGRWKPMDDLALIIGVQQTNDLRTVHLGTKFSCRFTVQELQQRWYALLYDEAVSRVAVAAMRSLHPDIVATVQDRALWSEAEEKLLSAIPSVC